MPRFSYFIYRLCDFGKLHSFFPPVFSSMKLGKQSYLLNATLITSYIYIWKEKENLLYLENQEIIVILIGNDRMSLEFEECILGPKDSTSEGLSWLPCKVGDWQSVESKAVSRLKWAGKRCKCQAVKPAITHTVHTCRVNAGCCYCY